MTRHGVRTGDAHCKVIISVCLNYLKHMVPVLVALDSNTFCHDATHFLVK